MRHLLVDIEARGLLDEVLLERHLQVLVLVLSGTGDRYEGRLGTEETGLHSQPLRALRAIVIEDVIDLADLVAVDVIGMTAQPPVVRPNAGILGSSHALAYARSPPAESSHSWDVAHRVWPLHSGSVQARRGSGEQRHGATTSAPAAPVRAPNRVGPSGQSGSSQDGRLE